MRPRCRRRPRRGQAGWRRRRRGGDGGEAALELEDDLGQHDVGERADAGEGLVGGELDGKVLRAGALEGLDLEEGLVEDELELLAVLEDVQRARPREHDDALVAHALRGAQRAHAHNVLPVPRLNHLAHLRRRIQFAASAMPPCSFSGPKPWRLSGMCSKDLNAEKEICVENGPRHISVFTQKMCQGKNDANCVW